MILRNMMLLMFILLLSAMFLMSALSLYQQYKMNEKLKESTLICVYKKVHASNMFELKCHDLQGAIDGEAN